MIIVRESELLMTDTSSYSRNTHVTNYRIGTILWFSTFCMITSALGFAAVQGWTSFSPLDTWLRASLVLALGGVVVSTLASIAILLPIRRRRQMAQAERRRILSFHLTAD